MGMARNGSPIHTHELGFPHPRGDGPPNTRQHSAAQEISPPAWGWPGTAERSGAWISDFPTRVGMARIDGDVEPSPH